MSLRGWMSVVGSLSLSKAKAETSAESPEHHDGSKLQLAKEDT